MIRKQIAARVLPYAAPENDTVQRGTRGFQDFLGNSQEFLEILQNFTEFRRTPQNHHYVPCETAPRDFHIFVPELQIRSDSIENPRNSPKPPL